MTTETCSLETQDQAHLLPLLTLGNQGVQKADPDLLTVKSGPLWTLSTVDMEIRPPSGPCW